MSKPSNLPPGVTDNDIEQAAGVPPGVSPLSILIYSVDHAQQRYDTCGDYFMGDNYLHITVSRLADRREMLLVAIHELIEWALCDRADISNERIDQFDMNWRPYTSSIDKEVKEPGDDFHAPYYHQHQIATGIERILAAEMGVDWLAYERHIEELSK